MKGHAMRYNNILILTPILFINLMFSQISQVGNPKSSTENLRNDIHIVSMPDVNKDALLQEDDMEMSKDVPYRFGTQFDVNMNLENSGTWEDIEGGRVWRLSIHSANAYSINLLFSSPCLHKVFGSSFAMSSLCFFLSCYNL